MKNWLSKFELRKDEIFRLVGERHKERFDTEKEVLDYFTLKNIEHMFGEYPNSQEYLDEIADLICNHDDGTFTTFVNKTN